MRVPISLLTVILITTLTLADETEGPSKEVEAKPEPNLEDAKLQELEDLTFTAHDNQDADVKRKKKSTTTTFCVEIRPSEPSQKPFQICEPAHSSSYYAAPSYPTHEQAKPQAAYQPAAYKPVAQPKPAPAYAAPTKTFVAPSAPAQKPYPGQIYSGYRAKNLDAAEDHDHMHMMRMSHASEEETASSEMVATKQARSSRYGNYGHSSYGPHGSMIPVVPKEKHGHNGLVITCQPNLAGYAHNVPSSFHHPSSVSYYRSSTARSNDDRGFGRYQYKASPPGPIQGFPSSFSQSAAFGPGVATASSGAVSNQVSPSSSPLAPGLRPQPNGVQPMPQPQYKTFQGFQAQPAVPSQPAASSYYGQPASSFGSLPGQQHQPLPYSAPAAASVAPQVPQPQMYSYSQAQAQAPAAQPMFPPPASYPASPAAPAFAAAAQPAAAQPPRYLPPGTFREAEEHAVHTTMSPAVKERQTMQTMQEISHQRVTEISTEASQKATEEHVGASNQAWQARNSGVSGEMDAPRTDVEQDVKNNEVNQ